MPQHMPNGGDGRALREAIQKRTEPSGANSARIRAAGRESHHAEGRRAASDRAEAAAAIEVILRAGRSAGLGLRLDTPVAASEPYLGDIDALLLLGTGLGIRGQDLAPEACERLAIAASLLGERHDHVRLIA